MGYIYGYGMKDMIDGESWGCIIYKVVDEEIHMCSEDV